MGLYTLEHKRTQPVNINIIREPKIIEASFRILGSEATQSFNNVAEQLRQGLDSVKFLENMTEENRMEKVRPFRESLEKLVRYLRLWSDQQGRGIEISRYIVLRKNEYLSQIEEFETENSRFQEVPSSELHEKLKDIVEQIEKSEIDKILMVNNNRGEG